MIRPPPRSSLFSYPTLFFFFFNDTATTEIYTLSLHDALPISLVLVGGHARWKGRDFRRGFPVVEKLVHGNFKGAGHFLQRFDARDGVAVLDARDVAAFEAGEIGRAHV